MTRILIAVANWSDLVVAANRAIASNLWYVILILPIIGRGVLAIHRRGRLTNSLGADARDSESNRSLILALAGFTFTAFAGLVLLTDQQQRNVFMLPMTFLLISFLAYLSSVNIQSYKFFEWTDILADTFRDVGTLALLCSLSTMVVAAMGASAYTWFVTVLCLTVWLIDFFVRITVEWKMKIK